MWHWERYFVLIIGSQGNFELRSRDTLIEGRNGFERLGLVD
jgi:hypothetical protein